MINAKTHKIDTWEDFERLKVYASKVDSPYFVVDLETNNKIEIKADLFGAAVCFNEQRAFYIVWRAKGGNKIWTLDQEKEIAKWFEDVAKTKKLINHNILYDVLVFFYNTGIDLTPFIYSDTLLQKHTLDEEPPFALKELAVLTFGDWADKAQQDLKDSVIANGGKWNKDNKDMYLADTAILAEYAMWDALLTFKLFILYEKRLCDEGLTKLFYEDEIMHLYRECTIPMKKAGFKVDVPYFENLKAEIEQEITKLEQNIHNTLADDIDPFVNSILNEEFAVKRSGNFPKVLADVMCAPLPMRKKKDKDTGEETLVVTTASKAIEAQKLATPEYSMLYDWILNESSPLLVDELTIDITQRKMFYKKYPERKFVFNLASNDHLAHYFFNVKRYSPLSKTRKGKMQVNATFIESLHKTHNDPIASKLIELKKLEKLVSTYINGILDRHIDGTIYASLLQFGTTSGRYSCKNPNLQNLPRVKDEESGLSDLVLKYVNAIRKGFVAGQGYKIVDADYSSLEPICFAEMSNSESLKNVFREGKDLYSQVAIDVNKLQDTYSADKKAPNFLKKHKPELRQMWKVPPLGIVYGMEEARLVQAIPGIDYKEAKLIINGYLNTYPELRKYMNNCNALVKLEGKVKTIFGRVRHLPEAKQLFEKHGNQLLEFRWARANNLIEERKMFKTCLNNAKNFPIQGLAGHIINRAMIATARELKAQGLDASIRLMIHDQVIVVAREDQAEQVKNIMRDKMQNTTKLSIPLVAEPEIADNLAESH